MRIYNVDNGIEGNGNADKLATRHSQENSDLSTSLNSQGVIRALIEELLADGRSRTMHLEKLAWKAKPTFENMQMLGL